jgi:hypothetical protein
MTLGNRLVTIGAEVDRASQRGRSQPWERTDRQRHPAEPRDRQDAYISAALVDGYRIQHDYFVNREAGSRRRGTRSRTALASTRRRTKRFRVNTDTPYSWLGLDLRAEPMVLTVPAIDEARYFVVQLIDLYTYNFDYIGSRATGSDGGAFLVAGPGWKGETPKGVKKVFRSETELALAAYRTQLFKPADLDNVTKVQAGYRAQPLAAFLGQPAPKAAPAIDFIKPLKPRSRRSRSKCYYPQLRPAILPHAAVRKGTHGTLREDRRRRGKTFDAAKLSPEIRRPSKGHGRRVGRRCGVEETSRRWGRPPATFRHAKALKNDYQPHGRRRDRHPGNSKEEAIYPACRGFQGKAGRLEGQLHVTLAKDQLPPVNGFWSVTMHELPSSIANPLKRYLINEPMLPQLKKDDDGRLTLSIQNKSPGKDKEANWLPAPKGPFMVIMRLYWPKEDALNGKWTAPPLKRME